MGGEPSVRRQLVDDVGQLLAKAIQQIVMPLTHRSDPSECARQIALKEGVQL